MTHKEKLEDSIHLRAVRYGAEHPNGFSYSDIQHHYSKRPAEWEVVRVFLLAAKKNKESGLNITTPFQVLNNRGSADEATDFILSYEAAFNYVDFLELQEARQMARDAHRSSTNAIRIAITTMVISNLLAMWQIFSPVVLDSDQYEYLIRAVEQ